MALLDLHTKRHRSAPTKAIHKRFFAAIKCTLAGRTRMQKRPRSKRPRDAHKTYLCGCWSSAYCRSDIGLQPRSACRRRSLRRKPCRCGCSNSSLSCKCGPADAGGVGVVNWPRRHRLRPARSRKKVRFARLWRVWLRIPQPNRAGGTGSARLVAVARHYGHLRRGGGDGGPAT